MFGLRGLAIAAVAMFALTAPALSHASIYSRVLRAYETNGSVPPCEFSSQQLQTALKGIDTYGAQYFADFTSAVQGALAARASGICAPARAGAGGPRPAAASQPLKLRPLTAATGAALPAPILLMAALALVSAVLGLGWWIAGQQRRAPSKGEYRANHWGA